MKKIPTGVINDYIVGSIYKFVSFFLRVKVSYLVVWSVGFILVYMFQLHQPGRGAAIVMSSQQFDLPVQILWANENEIGLIAGDAAASEPNILTMPLIFKTHSPSLLEPTAYAPEVSDTKPFRIPKSEAVPTAAACDDLRGRLAAVYPTGDHYSVTVWERRSPDRRGSQELKALPRFREIAGVVVPVSINEMAWMSLPSREGPGNNDISALMIFYSSQPKETAERGRQLMNGLKTSGIQIAPSFSGVICVLCREKGALPTRRGGDAPGVFDLSKTQQWSMTDLLPAHPVASWAGTGEADPINECRRIVTVDTALWTDTAKRRQPFVFQLMKPVAKSIGKKRSDDLVAKLFAIDIGQERSSDIEPGSVSFSGDGKSVFFSGPAFRPKFARDQLIGVSDADEWKHVRIGRKQGNWDNDLYVAPAPVDSNSFKKSPVRLLDIHTDGSRYPFGLVLTNSSAPVNAPGLPSFLFISAMNAKHYNIWIASNRDLNKSSESDFPWIELTYQRHITQPIRAFHSGNYLYVAAVDEEEVENGASTHRYRINIFRWRENDLYDQLSVLTN